MCFENLVFVILDCNFQNVFSWESNFEKMHFLREQLWKSIFWKYFFEGAILEMHFVRKQFWKCIFWNVFFEGTALKKTFEKRKNLKKKIYIKKPNKNGK